MKDTSPTSFEYVGPCSQKSRDELLLSTLDTCTVSFGNVIVACAALIPTSELSIFTFTLNVSPIAKVSLSAVRLYVAADAIPGIPKTQAIVRRTASVDTRLA